jgi:hypothetical protein
MLIFSVFTPKSGSCCHYFDENDAKTSILKRFLLFLLKIDLIYDYSDRRNCKK